MHKQGRPDGILAYWVNGELIGYRDEANTDSIGDQAKGIECAADGESQRCVVTWAVGAHGSIATLAELNYADGSPYWKTSVVQNEHVVVTGCTTPAGTCPS